MKWNYPFETGQARLKLVLVLMLASFGFLAVKLWRLQITEYGSHLKRARDQHMRRVRLPAPRGRIYDRHGVCLADNRPSYCMAVYVEELRQSGRWRNTVDEVDRVIDQLAVVLGEERQVSREDIWSHIRLQLPLPLIAWRDLGPRALARWAESSVSLRGVDLEISPVRHYPRGSSLAHVLGYVRRVHPEQDPLEPFDFYWPEMAGKQGLEASLERVLGGVPGGELYRVDASGYKNRVEKRGGRPAIPGGDVELTIDADIQAIAEEAIHSVTGAVVILDPRNGDVIAMASSPVFDPNLFSPTISSKEWGALKSDPSMPLLNRAISGIYPPGSTFKPVVALAALENGKASAATSFTCRGTFYLGRMPFACWRESGHGGLALQKAIEQSCNCYFYQLGIRTGHDEISHMAKAMGLGHRTGIRLNAELPGIVPTTAWKQERYGEGWYKGDTCNLSIGQGALVATPLQMALVTAAIANGGKVFRPRLVTWSDDPALEPLPEIGEILNQLGWNRKNIDLVRNGMRDVIQAERGTGKRARIEAVAMAGKTGTAQYGPAAKRKKHAWMIAYAPSERPRYALAIVIEDAISGGTSAAPLVKRIMGKVFEKEQERLRAS